MLEAFRPGDEELTTESSVKSYMQQHALQLAMLLKILLTGDIVHLQEEIKVSPQKCLDILWLLQILLFDAET